MMILLTKMLRMILLFILFLKLGGGGMCVLDWVCLLWKELGSFNLQVAFETYVLMGVLLVFILNGLLWDYFHFFKFNFDPVLTILAAVVGTLD